MTRVLPNFNPSTEKPLQITDVNGFSLWIGIVVFGTESTVNLIAIRIRKSVFKCSRIRKGYIVPLRFRTGQCCLISDDQALMWFLWSLMARPVKYVMF